MPGDLGGQSVFSGGREARPVVPPGSLWGLRCAVAGGGDTLRRPRVLLCVCRGCPGFERVDAWTLVNRLRDNPDVEFAVAHPQLCGDDGLRFLADLVRPAVTYLVGACDPALQRKMLKETFTAAGVSFDGQVVPLDLRNMTTEEAAEKVAEAVRVLRAGQ